MKHLNEPTFLQFINPALQKKSGGGVGCQKSRGINYWDKDMVSDESIKHMMIITVTPEQQNTPPSKIFRIQSFLKNKLLLCLNLDAKS